MYSQIEGNDDMNDKISFDTITWKCGCDWEAGILTIPRGTRLYDSYDADRKSGKLAELSCPVCHARELMARSGHLSDDIIGDDSRADRESWIGGGIPSLANGGDMAGANNSVWVE